MTEAPKSNPTGEAVPLTADQYLAQENDYHQTYIPRNVADAQRVINGARDVADNEFNWIDANTCDFQGEDVDPDLVEEYQDFADKGLDNWVLSKDDHDFYSDLATSRAVRGFKGLRKDLQEQIRFQRQDGEDDDDLFRRMQKEATQRLKLDKAIADFKAKSGEAEDGQLPLAEDLQDLNDYLADEWNVPAPDELEEADDLMSSLTRNRNGTYSNSRGEQAPAHLVEDIDDKLDRDNFLLSDDQLAAREDILDSESLYDLEDSPYWDEIAALLDKYENDMYDRGQDVGELGDYIDDLKDWCEKSIALHEWLEDNPDFLKTEVAARQKKAPKGKTPKSEHTTRTKEDIEKLTRPSDATLDKFGDEDNYKYELLFEELQDALGRNPTAKEMNQYLPGSGDALKGQADRGKTVKLSADTREFRAPKVKPSHPPRFVKTREKMRGMGEAIRTKVALGSMALANNLSRPEVDPDDTTTTTTSRSRTASGRGTSSAPRGRTSGSRGGRHV